MNSCFFSAVCKEIASFLFISIKRFLKLTLETCKLVSKTGKTITLIQSSKNEIANINYLIYANAQNVNLSM